eukprot:1027153-Amphidinium_carterae.1
MSPARNDSNNSSSPDRLSLLPKRSRVSRSAMFRAVCESCPPAEDGCSKLHIRASLSRCALPWS